MGAQVAQCSEPVHMWTDGRRGWHVCLFCGARISAKPQLRRVVCAAVRAADGSLLLGIRHYSADMHEQIKQRSDGYKFKHRHDEDQGFVDQHGVFLSRFEAYNVANIARQIADHGACGEGLDGPKLYSEGLY